MNGGWVVLAMWWQDYLKIRQDVAEIDNKLSRWGGWIAQALWCGWDAQAVCWLDQLMIRQSQPAGAWLS